MEIEESKWSAYMVPEVSLWFGIVILNFTWLVINCY